MEEILASIRRIISEDDAPPAAEAKSAPPSAPPSPAPEPEPVVHAPPEPELADEAEEEDDVLELSEPAPAPHESHGDIDVFETPKVEAPKPEPKAAEPAPAAPPEPTPQPTFAPVVEAPAAPAGGGLVSGHAADAAASHFGALAQSIALPASGRTLEDLVSELMKPMLKDWLDQHLPAMVEQAVRDEVDRISRRRVV